MGESEFRKRIEYKNGFSEEPYSFQNAEKRSVIVGRIITKLRLNRGYTQQEISDAIGIARQTYENGRHEPNIEVLITIAEIYGISLDLLTGRYSTTRNEFIKDQIRDEEINRAENPEEEILEKVELHEFREKKRRYNRAKKKTP